MSDNLRQYRAIREALTQGYPEAPTGRLARHLATLAACRRNHQGARLSIGQRMQPL